MTDTKAPSLLPTDAEVLTAARAMAGFNYLSMLQDRPWESLDKREQEHWVGLAKASLLVARPTPPSTALGEEIVKLARELREKAIKATAGEWQRRDTPDYAEIVTEGHNLAMVATEKDTDHIAACDPPTIIRLCNAVLGEGK